MARTSTGTRSKRKDADSLSIAPGLTLPLQAVTETFAILAMRRSGKSNAAVVMAEEFYDAGLPWVVIDPKGDWWGIRSDRDGEGPGLAVTVFGGPHGDLPLEPTAGAVIADLIVDERISCVLDISAMDEDNGDRTRFLVGFAKRLYERNTEPLHVFFEEAEDFLSQTANKSEMQVVRAFARLIKMGGFKGIGVTLISQRSANLNKNVLNQAENLIAMRTTAPNDRKAVADWVAGKVDRAEVAGDLAGLGKGEAWVIAPSLIDDPTKVTFRRRRTFNSGATPEVGVVRKTPKRLAPVDLSRIQQAMAATIERAEADDPDALRRRIAALEKDLTAARRAVKHAGPSAGNSPSPEVVEKVVEKVVEVPALTAEQEQVLATSTERIREYAANATSRAEHAVGQIRAEVEKVGALLAEIRPSIETTASAARRPAAPPRKAAPAPPARAPRPNPGPARAPAASPASDGDVPPARRRLLDALVSLESIGVEAAPRNQVALFAGVSPKSSGFANNLGALNTAGLITYPQRGQVQITDAGREHADQVPVAATTEDLHERVQGVVSPARWRLVEPLLAAYPDPISKDDLADAAGVSAKSSGYANNLGALRSLGLIDYPSPGYVEASPLLFLD